MTPFKNRNPRVLLKQILLYLFAGPLKNIIPFIPLRLSYLLIGYGAGIYYRFISDKRNLIKEELSKRLNYLSASDIDIISKNSFCNFVKSKMDVLLFPFLDKKKIERIVSVKGLKNLDDALSKGRGAILLTAHFGSYKFIIASIGYRGYKVNQIGIRPIRQRYVAEDDALHKSLKRIFNMEMRYENHLPAKFIYYDDRPMRIAFRRLASNEVLIIAGDGRYGSTFIQTEFLNAIANFSTGPMKLARMTNAEVLPVFIIRQKDNLHQLIIEKPLDLERSDNRENDTLKSIKKWVKIIAEHHKVWGREEKGNVHVA